MAHQYHCENKSINYTSFRKHLLQSTTANLIFALVSLQLVTYLNS